MTDLREIVSSIKEGFGEAESDSAKYFDLWFENAMNWWDSCMPPTDTWYPVEDITFQASGFPGQYMGWDIEIAYDIPEDVEDWHDVAPLGITCGAISRGNKVAGIWRSNDSSPMSMEQCQDMVRTLMDLRDKGYIITTWNGLSFDFDVLAMESGMIKECAELALGHVDMMYHVVCQKGFGVGLDTVAKTMGVGGKSEGMTGSLAPVLWRNGDFDRVLGYVAQDAKSTADVANACEKHGKMLWTTKKGKEANMPLPNGWLTVEKANKLPVPDTSWMDDASIWSRERFMKWTR